MSEKIYYVHWVVDMGEGIAAVHNCIGPMTLEQATQEHRDITTFVGIKRCRITTSRDEEPTITRHGGHCRQHAE